MDRLLTSLITLINCSLLWFTFVSVVEQFFGS